jgi:hypothetical protein
VSTDAPLQQPASLVYQCCFCGASIAEGTLRILVLEVSDGGSQELPCHEQCLRRAVHPSVPLAF